MVMLPMMTPLLRRSRGVMMTEGFMVRIYFASHYFGIRNCGQVWPNSKLEAALASAGLFAVMYRQT